MEGIFDSIHNQERMTKSIAIIGGGIAGLSAGIYARMNGFETDIYEMQSMAGGLCTAWKRKGFTFDGCIHWLTGTTPSSEYYRLWEEIGAVQDKKFHDYEYYTQTTDKEGRRFIAWADLDKLENEMLSIGPEDKRQIRKVIGGIRQMMKHELPLDINFRNGYRIFRALLMIYKFREPVSALSAKFKNPVLRNLFLKAFDWGPMCSAFALWTMGLMIQRNAGYPIGGSLGMIASVEKRYLELGGRLYYRSKVTKILTENNRATGIQLVDGSVREADIVISAADGRTTIFDWLEGKYIDQKVQKIYDSFILFPPLVFVSLGIDGKFMDAPHSLTFELKDPFRIGPDEIPSLFVKNYSFDPTMAPEGKCVFTSMISSNFEYWETIHKNKDRYEEEKKRIGEEVIKRLGQVYPGFEQKVEVIDVATPMTFVRYTGNYHGAYQGFFLDKQALKTMIPQELPGLHNFYMAGQWVSPGGGLPSGLITGRNAIRRICKKEKKKFVSFV